jgi:hypothetical protein
VQEVEFVAPFSEAREELNRRLDPDMSDRVRSQLRHGVSSLLTALSESNGDTSRVRVRVGYGPEALTVELEHKTEREEVNEW